MKKNTILLLLSTITFGCSDYKLQAIPEYAPEIIVDPTIINFGPLNSGYETKEERVNIFNVGNDTLNVENLQLKSSSGVFSITPLETSTLEPGESADFYITYSPETFSTDSAEVFIDSNDEDESRVIVSIGGSGDAPVIDISPDYHDFGVLDIGCDEQLEVKISNIGNANLEINDIKYFSTVPLDYISSDFESLHGTFPWSISPGDSMNVFIDYIPSDLYSDLSYLEVYSSDPATPVANADQYGEGDYFANNTDEFDQEEQSKTDILFVVDNSGSMGANQTQLSNNFDSFINVFSASGVDYQIAFITTDSYEFVGDIITPATPDPVAEAMSQISAIGYRGSALERAYDMTYHATQYGADAGPGSSFLRDDSKLVVIFISDEDEGSHSPVTDWTIMESQLLSLKTSSSMVVAHAVAGDVPSGCSGNGGAVAGTEFNNLVTSMGGTFLSICAEDWGTPMEELARDSMLLGTFLLSEAPIEETIEVFVDGVPNSDWTYDGSINGVVFYAIPPEGSEIKVDYAIYGECE